MSKTTRSSSEVDRTTGIQMATGCEARTFWGLLGRRSPATALLYAQAPAPHLCGDGGWGQSREDSRSTAADSPTPIRGLTGRSPARRRESPCCCRTLTSTPCRRRLAGTRSPGPWLPFHRLLAGSGAHRFANLPCDSFHMEKHKARLLGKGRREVLDGRSNKPQRR